jgi:hypothetical protein
LSVSSIRMAAFRRETAKTGEAVADNIATAVIPRTNRREIMTLLRFRPFSAFTGSPVWSGKNGLATCGFPRASGNRVVCWVLRCLGARRWLRCAKPRSFCLRSYRAFLPFRHPRKIASASPRRRLRRRKLRRRCSQGKSGWAGNGWTISASTTAMYRSRSEERNRDPPTAIMCRPGRSC